MFDAYANGGKGIDGKPVTDQRMRAYMVGRRAGFSKDDPLYSEWSNRITQLDFKIGEDKVTLAYQQGKVGAGAVASYYRHQLSTIPQDSAFYREVAGRAAQWAKAAVGAARGRARASLTKALEGKQNGVASTWQNFSSLEGVLTDAAKRAGLIAGTETLTDADATDLEAFLKAGVPGPHGTTITFADWQHASTDAYKAFDTQISINKQLNRGTKELTSQKQKFLDQNLVRINTIDDRAKYEVARDTFEAMVGESKGDPRAILDAAQTYAATLGTIKTAAEKVVGGIQGVDPEFIGGLTNEITALTTGKGQGSTVFDLQSTTGEGSPTSDMESTVEAIAKAQDDVKALGNGTAFYGQDKFGGAMKVNYFPPGAALDPFGRNGLDDSFQPAVINIDGKPTQVMLKGQPVQSAGLVGPDGIAVTNVNGIPIENLNANQIAGLAQQGYTLTKDTPTIGYVFAQGEKITYGVRQSDGSLQFTTQNPFGSDLSQGKDALQVIGGSTLGTDGKTVVPAPPVINQVDLNSFLADESITPKDLMSLAAVSSDPRTAEGLTALADKRQKGQQAETDYMNRARQGGQAEPTFGGSLVAGALKFATDTLREATVKATPLDTTSAAPPALPGLRPVSSPTAPNQAPSIGETPIPVGQPGNALIPGAPKNPTLGAEVPIPVGQPGNALQPGAPKNPTFAPTPSQKPRTSRSGLTPL